MTPKPIPMITVTNSSQLDYQSTPALIPILSFSCPASLLSGTHLSRDLSVASKNDIDVDTSVNLMNIVAIISGLAIHDLSVFFCCKLDTHSILNFLIPLLKYRIQHQMYKLYYVTNSVYIRSDNAVVGIF